MLTENKLSKYLLYAIGEIALVIIGILIALQINNVNQDRQNREYEVLMLNEVKESLLDDIDNLKRNSTRLQQVQYSLQEVTKMKNDSTIPRDSLYTYLDVIDSYGTAYRANKSPFEAIESGGLDKISNPEIRNALSKLYGFRLNSMENWIWQVHGAELLKRNDIKEEIFGYNMVVDKGLTISNKLNENSVQKSLKHPRIDAFLYTSGWPLNITINYMKITEREMNEMIDLIEDEIKK